VLDAEAAGWGCRHQQRGGQVSSRHSSPGFRSRLAAHPRAERADAGSWGGRTVRSLAWLGPVHSAEKKKGKKSSATSAFLGPVHRRPQPSRRLRGDRAVPLDQARQGGGGTVTSFTSSRKQKTRRGPSSAQAKLTMGRHRPRRAKNGRPDPGGGGESYHVGWLLERVVRLAGGKWVFRSARRPGSQPNWRPGSSSQRARGTDLGTRKRHRRHQMGLVLHRAGLEHP